MPDEIIEEYVDEYDTEEKPNWKKNLERFLDGRYFMTAILVLVAVISFCLGRLSSIEEKREPVKVISGNISALNSASVLLNNTGSLPVASSTTSVNSAGQVVASKNGNKYHYPWCPGAKQISEKNKITFNSIEEAKSAGYSAASNCKGLK